MELSSYTLELFSFTPLHIGIVFIYPIKRFCVCSSHGSLASRMFEHRKLNLKIVVFASRWISKLEG
ncbi:hypothetical protein BpHYR1_021241 [Brachionus plicatilis]|uniref:Uncharacterized protein n=1 Tax=Brachionus plicatilis TaxID=10195 RepID=A0A3M7T5T3_BRAPC|nr:hypothetical protein BpHYR1_021241 [Brachionus plicatilis]